MAHISVRDVSGGVVARTRATGRIRPSGLVLLRHGIKRRRMFVRALWSMPMNRVIRQEAYPLERVESVTPIEPYCVRARSVGTEEFENLKGYGLNGNL